MCCLRCFWLLLLGLAAGSEGEARMFCRGGPGCLESPNHVVHGARCVLGVQNTLCAVPGVLWVLQMCCLRCFWLLLLGLAAAAGGEARMLWREVRRRLESPNHVEHGAQCVLGVQNTVCAVPGVPWVL